MLKPIELFKMRQNVDEIKNIAGFAPVQKDILANQWTLNSSTMLYEFRLVHKEKVPLKDLALRFYNNLQYVDLDYNFVSDTEVIIFNTEATNIICIIHERHMIPPMNPKDYYLKTEVHNKSETISLLAEKAPVELTNNNTKRIDDITSQLVKKADATTVYTKANTDSLVATKRDKSTSIVMSDLSTEVKTAMTGGSVAVVGTNAIGSENVKDEAILGSKIADDNVGISKLHAILEIGSVIKGIIEVNTKIRSVTVSSGYVAWAGAYRVIQDQVINYTGVFNNIYFNKINNNLECHPPGNLSQVTVAWNDLVLLGTIYYDKIFNVIDQKLWNLNGESLIPPIPEVPETTTGIDWLKGKRWLAFGDSITEGVNEYPDFANKKLKMTLTNKGYGGSSMALRTREDVVSFNPYCFVNRIKDNDIDLTQVDYITIAYGTNDWSGDVPIGTSFGEGAKNDTFKGALMNSLQYIWTINPTVKILIFTPLYRQNCEYRDNALGLKLIDYVNAVKECCNDRNLMCLDLFSTAGFNYNTYNALTKDGLHPNLIGAERVGDIVAHKLLGI